MWCQFLLKNWGNKIEAKDLKKLFLKSWDECILAQNCSDSFFKVMRVEKKLAKDCKIKNTHTHTQEIIHEFSNLIFIFSIKYSVGTYILLKIAKNILIR